MQYLFNLVLVSSVCFSLYIWATANITNPLIFVLIGWGPPVLAYYLVWLWERTRLFVLNRTFECFVINEMGDVWNGKAFVKDGFPYILYNDVQIDAEVKRIIDITENSDLYIRIIPSQENIEEEDDE